MSSKMQQTGLFRGIYEYEDPSGTLLAAKIPVQGSADLYDGTVVVVRPNQCCLFVYKGEVAELYLDGTHQLKTGNLPVLTQLANYKLGFKSPLRAELWFFSGQVFTGRRWGTAGPLLVPMEGHGTIPLRMFGQYNLVLRDPAKFFGTLVGSRSAFDITELEDFVQGQIQELAPEAMKSLKRIEDLSSSQDKVSKELERLLEQKLRAFGVKVLELQVQSITPGQEIVKALETKAAMQAIGDPKTYLLYQAAQSLNQAGTADGGDRGNDPMQMMLGLMLGKNLMDQGAGREARAPAEPALELARKAACGKCGAAARAEQKFCGECGAKL